MSRTPGSRFRLFAIAATVVTVVASSAGVASAATHSNRISVNPSRPVIDQVATLTASAKACRTGNCTYVWTDDGPDGPGGGTWPLGNGASIDFTFHNAGAKHVRLTVTTAEGKRRSWVRTIRVAKAGAGSTPGSTPATPTTGKPAGTPTTDAPTTTTAKPGSTVTTAKPTTTTAKPVVTTAAPAPAPTAAPVSNGAFPSAASTGYKPGTTLTKMGSVNITKAGQVLENVEINGCVTIAPGADNVIIRNSLIKSNGCFWLVLNDDGAKNLQIIDTELDGLNGANNDAAVGGYNYTLTRVNIHGTSDGAKVGNNVTVQDSYIHDMAVIGDSHNDGLQSLGTNSLTIKHNTIILKGSATSAIILSTNNADSMKNIVIDGNLMGGGAFTVYGGYQSGTDSMSKVGNIKITNNKFTTQIFPKGGAFGPITSIDSPVVFSGNTWYDGPNKGQTIS